VTGDISSLNEAIVAEDADKISEALERLKESSMEIGKAIYATSSDDSGSGDGEQQQDGDADQQSDEKKDEEEGEKKEGEEKK